MYGKLKYCSTLVIIRRIVLSLIIKAFCSLVNIIFATEKFETKNHLCSAAFHDIIPTDHDVNRCIDVNALRSAQRLLQVDLHCRVGPRDHIEVCGCKMSSRTHAITSASLDSLFPNRQQVLRRKPRS
jgi:hypothetical protein